LLINIIIMIVITVASSSCGEAMAGADDADDHRAADELPTCC